MALLSASVTRDQDGTGDEILVFTSGSNVVPAGVLVDDTGTPIGVNHSAPLPVDDDQLPDVISGITDVETAVGGVDARLVTANTLLAAIISDLGNKADKTESQPMNWSYSGVPSPIPFIRHMDKIGDGSGDSNMNDDFGSPQEFKIVPPASTIYTITRIEMFCEFNGSGYNMDRLAGASSAISPGLTLSYRNNSTVLKDLTEGIPIVADYSVARFFDRFEYLRPPYGTKDMWKAWIDFATPIRLDGDSNEYLAWRAEGDFRVIDDRLYAKACGFVEGTET